MENSISVLISDDHLLVRQGFKKLLERQDGITVLNEDATNGKEALSKTIKLKPDILLLDINMPEMSGLDTLKQIREKDLQQKIIMLTIHDTREYVLEAVRLGADGYVSKDVDIKILMDAIVSVYKGDKYLQSGIIENLDSFNDKLCKAPALRELLTNRELEVLKLITKGINNKGIAKKLGVTDKTVRNHLSSIFKKIDVSDRTQAALYALENGILAPFNKRPTN